MGSGKGSHTMGNAPKYSALIGLAALVLAGCAGESASNWHDTGRIRADIDLHSGDGHTIHVDARLTVPASSDAYDSEDPIYIRLRDGDQLWASTGVNVGEVDFGNDWFGELSELAHAQQLLESNTEYRALSPYWWGWNRTDDLYYHGSLEDVPEGERYYVSLDRENERDALESSVVMPGSFELVEPGTNQTLSRSGDALMVEWLPLEDNVSVEINVTTECGGDFRHEHLVRLDSDSGVHTFEPGAIDDASLSGACATTVAVAKRRVGELDPAYASGVITARQVRSVNLRTVD